MAGGFFWGLVWVGFFLSWGIEFRFKTILRSRVQQSTAAETGGQGPGEQERAASSRGKCPAAEKLEENPTNGVRDGQGAPRWC